MYGAELILADLRHIAPGPELDDNRVVSAVGRIVVSELAAKAFRLHADNGFHARIKVGRPVKHFPCDHVLAQLQYVAAQGAVHGELKKAPEPFGFAKAFASTN